MTGGGSGGHITPILAVAHELKVLQPAAEIIYIGQRGDQLSDIPAQDKNIDKTYSVRAGKLRRYHGESLARQLLDVPTVLKNLRDMVWVVIGIWQSFWLMRRLRPAIVFTRGGFVSVPVALGAKLNGIPFITHDSDALPSLANRIIGRWAALHAVALPKEIYPYNQAKTVTTGIPISHEYRPVTTKQVHALKERLGLGKYDRLLLVTGGGNGALALNKAIASCVPDLLARYKDLAIVQLAGRAHEAALRQTYSRELSASDAKRMIVKGFVTNLHEYSAASDVIITRAGATSIAEFAAQAKPCVVIPNPVLAGGHQLKNAEVLADRKAVKMVNERLMLEDGRALLPPLVALLDDRVGARKLGARLHEMEQTGAAQRLAMLLLEHAQS